jgi:hypothetical protein
LSVYHQNEAVQFLQRKLQDEMEKTGRVCMSNTIRQDRWYGTNAKRIQVMNAMNKVELEKMDLHCRIAKSLPKDKELELVDFVYDASNSNLTRLAQCNLVSMYTHCRQVGVRGKEDRNLYFYHAFIGTMERLGEGRTNNVDNFMHLTGKTNRTGRLDYKSFAAHMNPRLDSGGHMGDMVLERFTMMKEGFPIFLDPKDYSRRPVFRSVQSKDAKTPPDHVYELEGCLRGPRNTSPQGNPPAPS